MTATLEGSYLDPKLVIHIDDENMQQPIFEGLFKEMVKGGSEVALELQEYLKRMDAKRHEVPDDTVSFPALDPEYGETCEHGLPARATCSWCLDGIASSKTEPAAATYVIGDGPLKKGKLYGKTKKQRRRWYRKVWDAIWEVTE